MTCGILALQGAFIEHQQKLSLLGESSFEIRQMEDLNRSFDRLILPGGESTVQSKLLHELGLFEPIKQLIIEGMPVLGTCAGLILLAQSVDGMGDMRGSNDDQASLRVEVSQLQTLPVTVVRNAYGRQLGSFHAFGTCNDVVIPMTFIRAPQIAQVLSPEVEILSELDDVAVAVRYGNQLGVAFHPELDEDTYLYEYFLAL